MFQYTRRRGNIAWSNTGLPSYSYRFDVTVNGIPAYLGATHFQEVGLVFDNTLGVGYDVNPFGGNDSTAAALPALAKAMSNAWVRFFTTLDPNGPGGLAVEWPVYSTSTGGGVAQNVVFDVNGSYVEQDVFRAEGMSWMIENSLSLFGN